MLPVGAGARRPDCRLDTFVAGSLYFYRAAYWIALALGSIALGLTLIGIYGVVAYIVGQRTREIGNRIALGATARSVLSLILAESARHALIGLTIGGVLAVGVARILASTVQGMPAFDLVAFASAFSCVFGACAAAALLPARRATSIDPSASLRED